MLVRETEAEIALRSSAGLETVARDELASLVSTGRSPMPEGFEDLGAAALRDLLAYLCAGYDAFRVVDDVLRPGAAAVNDGREAAERDALASEAVAGQVVVDQREIGP